MNNAKGMWKQIQNILPQSLKSSPNIALFDGLTVLDVANKFNFHFAKIGTKLANAIPKVRLNPLNYTKKVTTANSNKFIFNTIDPISVESDLKKISINKATGLDGIHPRILRDAAPIIGNSLCYIFNMSLNTGVVPDEWKCAKITALHKSGSLTNPDNYRPISVLSVVSELLEKYIHNQFNEYLKLAIHSFVIRGPRIRVRVREKSGTREIAKKHPLIRSASVSVSASVTVRAHSLCVRFFTDTDAEHGHGYGARIYGWLA